MREPLIIGNEVFTTKKAAIDRCRQILYGYEIDEPICGQDESFLLHLLLRHPDAPEKSSGGIDMLVVQENVHHGKRTRGFWILRGDGTRMDFSFYECLSPTPHERRVRSAMRFEVDPQIEELKHHVFDGRGKIHCPVTGSHFDVWRACVHHQPPETFAVLCDGFRRCMRMRWDDIEIESGATKALFGDRIVDRHIANMWQSFHRTYATLVVVSEQGHKILHARSAEQG